MFDYFICYHLESGWHVSRPNQGLSLGRAKSLGTRLRTIPKTVKCPWAAVFVWGSDHSTFKGQGRVLKTNSCSRQRKNSCSREFRLRFYTCTAFLLENICGAKYSCTDEIFQAPPPKIIWSATSQSRYMFCWRSQPFTLFYPFMCLIQVQNSCAILWPQLHFV